MHRQVYIIDDEPDDLAFLAGSLTNSGYLTTTYTNGTDFIDAVAGLSPGCVLLDVHMPGLDGLQVLNSMGDLRDTFPVVMLSGQSDIPIAVSAMKLGAVGFLEKPCDPTKLLLAINDAFEVAAKNEAETTQTNYAKDLLERLTPREKQVLGLLILGKSNKIVAHELGLSERTVEVHRSRMMARLGVASFAQMIRLAVRAGADRDLSLGIWHS